MNPIACRPPGGLRRLIRPLACALLVALAACSEPASIGPVTVSGAAGGNAWSVTVGDPPDGMTKQSLRQVVADVLAQVRHQVSGRDSALKRFNRAAAGDWVSVPAAFAELVQKTLALGRETVGAYDVTRRSLLRLWGVGGLAQPDRLPTREELTRARQRTGVGLVAVRNEPAALRKAIDGVRLYLADILAGYRVRLLSQRLEALGATRWRIRFGDTLLVHAPRENNEPFTTRVQAPGPAPRVTLDGHHAMARATAPKPVVLGRRRYSAVIDPRTGRPVAHRGYSVTVIAEDAVRANALARALLVMGLRAGLHFANAHGIAARFAHAAKSNQTKPTHSQAFTSYLAAPGAARPKKASPGKLDQGA